MNTTELQRIKQRYNIVGNDEALNHALDIALQVAPTDLSVLIVGESGVGKEIFPRVIHDNSPRRREKYFAINCGSIPEGTIDSELFGHEKGAYTGAIGESEGYFGVANKGTIFLDEVGELPLATQARLLRVLETGEYIRVGGQEIRKTDVRIVAATNVNMRKAVSEGKFREDLYYRLNTIPIHIPPLRERGNDIILLFRLFAMQMAEKYRLPKITLTDDAKQLMLHYKWPGNVRELTNLVERLAVLHPGGLVRVQDLPARYRGDFPIPEHNEVAERTELRLAIQNLPPQEIVSTAAAPAAPGNESAAPATDDLPDNGLDLKDHMARIELKLISDALERTQGVVAHAAQLLGLRRTTLVEKLRKYGIDREQLEVAG